MKALLILCISGAVLAQTPPPVKKAPAPGTPATKAPATPAKTAPRPNPLLNPAALKAVAPPLYRVKFTTTKGDFIVEVHREWAPLGADRFWNLVRNKFFNDAAFFRDIANFIVQFGLPADPAVSKAWQTANIKDEPVKQGNKLGALVYAKAGPDSRTTQLFINLKDNSPSLDGTGFAAFGTVTEGMEVVQSFYSGYGEAPDQGSITNQGKAYLDKNFPKLDLIKSTTVIFPEPAAPAVKKAPATGTPATKTGTPPATKATPPAAPKKQ
jgi:peptidyl-prolyl cis-trans isomerase A (cyclophilin A)